MNLKQLKVVQETVRQRFRVTDAAGALSTSQSGVSKQIKELEIELGIQLFERRGKRLTRLTPSGEQVFVHLDHVLRHVAVIERLAAEHSKRSRGVLRVATTHTQARYVLPSILVRFRSLYPDVKLTILQANPKDIGGMLLRNAADVGVATDAMEHFPDLVNFPFRTWKHTVIAPINHPLVERERITLSDLAAHPIVTYEDGLTGRAQIDKAFFQAGYKPDITMAALDADVIKKYVEMGFGVGVIAEVAFEPERDTGLRQLRAEDLFGRSQTSIAVRKGAMLRNFTYRFIELCSPEITEQVARQAVDSA